MIGVATRRKKFLSGARRLPRTIPMPNNRSRISDWMTNFPENRRRKPLARNVIACSVWRITVSSVVSTSSLSVVNVSNKSRQRQLSSSRVSSSRNSGSAARRSSSRRRFSCVSSPSRYSIKSDSLTETSKGVSDSVLKDDGVKKAKQTFLFPFFLLLFPSPS